VAVPFVSPEDMIAGEPLPGWHGRFFHAEHMTFAHYDIDAGAPDLHAHHHDQEEVWHVVGGEVAIRIGDEERTLRAGEAAVIPPKTPHSVRVVGACRVVVADHPRRDELPRGVGGRDRRP
jgi:mannose-6-phosphate isomerase-like protein (cupin superfamily)